MKIAITGATGFIGSKIALHYQNQGATVHILTRQNQTLAPKNTKVFCHDLALEKAERLISFLDGCDIVYHCSAEIRNPAIMYQTNVVGTKKLIDAASGRIGRWVQLSSVGAYGSQRDGVVTECTKLNPSGSYEISKVESDALVAEAALKGAFEYSILRPSNVYGAQMKNQSIFGLITMIQRGMFFYIGEQGATANYIHVDNVVSALLLCGTHSAANGQTYNLSDQCSIERFVAIIASELNKPAPTRRLPEWLVRMFVQVLGSIPKFPLTSARVDALTGRSTYTNAKIQNELGYHHIVSIEDGLKEMVQYWHQQYKL